MQKRMQVGCSPFFRSALCRQSCRKPPELLQFAAASAVSKRTIGKYTKMVSGASGSHLPVLDTQVASRELLRLLNAGKKLRTFEGPVDDYAVGTAAGAGGTVNWPLFKWAGGSNDK